MNVSRNLRVVGAVLVVVLSIASPAVAWNSKGHMMVAYVAYRKLTPAARARVDELLRLNPDYGKWETTVPVTVSRAEKRLRIFMMASTWPDQIKVSESYTDDGTDNGRRPD